MKRLIVLRPEPGAAATLEMARELGLEATAIPLFELKAVAWNAPDAAGFGGLLLSSANAVRHGGEQLQSLRGLEAYCVGKATAEAAREAGFGIAATGTAGVDRLLSSIEADVKLLHLAGRHRTEPLQAKQEITTLAVYESQEVPAPGDLAKAEGAVVAVHSVRAAQRFAQLAADMGVQRSKVAIAAISEKVAAQAGSGWWLVESAEKPEDSSLLALARSMCDTADR